MFQDSYTVEDWRTLQFAPLWISAAVAGADGKVEESEAGVGAERVASVAVGERSYDDPLVQELFGSIGEDIEAVGQAFLADSRDTLQGLSDIADVLNRGAAAEHAAPLKAELIKIAIATAEASETKPKGLLGRFREAEQVSDEEKAALVAVTAALEGELDALRSLIS